MTASSPAPSGSRRWVFWIFLALAIVCVGAAVGVTVVHKKKENGDDASHSDRG